MATLGTGQLTLLDFAKRTDPNGSTAAVAELLSQYNDVLEDAVFKEGNLPTGHRVTVRTGLPTVYWRQLNTGVPPSKSTTAQVDEPAAILEAYSQIDKDLAMLNGNTAAFRMSEDSAFIEAMAQEQAQTLFYGNVASDMKEYTGLATRYSSSSAGNGQNVLLGGGAGSDNTSIYLVGWGENSVFCTYPKGSKAGLQVDDLGEDRVADGAGGYYQALVSHYQWKNGLVVKDWRYAVRVANIDVSNLTGESSAANLVKLMTKALWRLPSWNNIRPCFYANRTVYEMLMIQALNASGGGVGAAGAVANSIAGNLSIRDSLNQFGTTQRTLMFMGFPMRVCDQILNTETLIS